VIDPVTSAKPCARAKLFSFALTEKVTCAKATGAIATTKNRLNNKLFFVVIYFPLLFMGPTYLVSPTPIDEKLS